MALAGPLEYSEEAKESISGREPGTVPGQGEPGVESAQSTHLPDLE